MQEIKRVSLSKDASILLIVTMLLICLGIVMVYSASSCNAYEDSYDSAFYLKRHLINFSVGLVLFLLVYRVNYLRIKNYTKWLLAFSVISLLVVFLPGIGHEAGGARRWIKIGPIGFQPSELSCLCLILYLADLLERKELFIKNILYGFMPPLVISGSIVFLVLLQPDLGTAVTLLTVSVLMMFAAGANMMYFLPFIGLVLPAFYFLIFKVPYRLRRIIGYLDPWNDAQNAGFQIIQSFLALGSGGLLGVGLGCSRQKLFYLPQAHTDFIFSIIGEELGLVATLSVVFLFCIFIWQGIKISATTKDMFGKLVAFGLTVNIGLRAIINIAVSTGAIPTKGLPLPFISYGGTALIMNMVSVALILSIAKR
ncbi:MAG: putative lipid II flippase FtsW [Candidatus Omnitrophota bacterium]